MRIEVLSDFQDLFGCLAGSVDHFRDPLPHTAVQICLRKAQIIIGNFTKLQGSLLHGGLSCGNLFQKSL